MNQKGRLKLPTGNELLAGAGEAQFDIFIHWEPPK